LYSSSIASSSRSLLEANLVCASEKSALETHISGS
jgi:hypothetical protein